MIATKITVIDIHPSTNVRSTQGDKWLFGAADDYIEAYDNKRILLHGKKGRNMARKRQLEKYNAYKQELRNICTKQGFEMPLGYFALWFYVPYPKSWRKPKIAANLYKAHQTTPDWDNFIKAMFDGLMPRKSRYKGEKGVDDRKVHCGAIFKVWVRPEEACIKVVEYAEEDFTEQFKEGHPSFIGV